MQKLNQNLLDKLTEETIRHKNSQKMLNSDKSNLELQMIQNYNRQKLNLDSPKQIQTSFCLVENYFLEQMNARA